MDVLVLGPAELRSGDGGTVAVGGPRRWAVLAVLAAHLNETVPVERLADEVWAGSPPPTARAALQGHITVLRRLLGEGLDLTTTGAGYRLGGDRAQVDVCRFDDLVSHARATRDDGTAAALLVRALESWRGDVVTAPTGEAVCPALSERLSERRVRALEALTERLLLLGRADEVVPGLTLAVRAYALRESLVRLLMLCLQQTGRRADALELYEQTREGLAVELGAEPGPLLDDALARISRGADAPAPWAPELPAAPRQLPRRTSGFVGRTEELSALDRAAAEPGGVVAVVGPAGVGKSALAVRWAHHVAERFPGGQLFADLRGFGEGEPVGVDVVVAGFLRALGVTGGDVPAGEAERTALFRRLMAQRRLLVVLDNVRDAAGVRALLPDGTAGSLVVVTSRSTLSELEFHDGAPRLILAPLPTDDAVALVEAVVGAPRVRAEPEAVLRWVELCDRLPLALRISASRLLSRPHWTVAQTVEEIGDERTRLAGLGIPGGVGVRAAMTVTRRLLPPEAARLLTLLGLLPAEELDACVAAALTGSGLSAARRSLGVLAALHVLEETRPGRFRRHNLVGLYARQLLAETCGEAETRTVWCRLIDYCVAAAGEGARPLAPYPWLLEPAATAGAGLPRGIGTAAGAVAWFGRHEPLVRAVLHEAMRLGEYDRAYRLTQNVYMFYYLAGTAELWVEVCRAGLRAAVASRSADGVAHAHSALGVALVEAGHTAEGIGALERAREQDVPQPRDRLVTFMRLGVGYVESGGPHEAAEEALETAARIADALGDTRSKALAHYHLSRCLPAAGRLEEALEHADAGLDLLAEAPDNEQVWLVLMRARLLQRLGRVSEALPPARSAAETFRRLGYAAREPESLRLLGTLLLALDRAEEACEPLRAAVALLDRTGSALAAEARRELAKAEARSTPRPAAG
ncbi:AfsR/SARP family transcriptional regulator [Streptomyces sp.]|uniref:AfsR/SARP family transcriptional regulator n=1 Tax=Streptomyces sp. TaxID=1931 RepID=UPI002F40B859